MPSLTRNAPRGESMIPNNITRQHVLMAIEAVDQQGVPPKRQSRDYVLQFQGTSYPPKYLVSLANECANGARLRSSVFYGGDETNGFLASLGFSIMDTCSSIRVAPGPSQTYSLANQRECARPAAEGHVTTGISPRVATGELVHHVAGAFQRIPWACWERVVHQDASYQTMRPFAEMYGPGPFLTLMVLAGLNDYWPKGKAETGYWPPLRRQLEASRVPSSPNELGKSLEPFYRAERAGKYKVARMYRFLSSELGSELWHIAPARAASDLASLWYRIAHTMRQQPAKKTIAFAAKCLAMGLVMLGQRDFDFFGVPIPADSRLRQLTPYLDDDRIRTFWHDVLVAVRQRHPQLTHLHLDTLLWHYLGSEDRSHYLQTIGLVHTHAQEIGGVLRRLSASL